MASQAAIPEFNFQFLQQTGTHFFQSLKSLPRKSQNHLLLLAALVVQAVALFWHAGALLGTLALGGILLGFALSKYAMLNREIEHLQCFRTDNVHHMNIAFACAILIIATIEGPLAMISLGATLVLAGRQLFHIDL